jgi:hypothetical protein
MALRGLATHWKEIPFFKFFFPYEKQHAVKAKINISIYSLIAIGFSFVLFLYIILRAYKVAFTHDESCTLFSYVLMPEKWGVLSLVSPSSNNHFLNTFLMIPFFYLFGFNEFTLRLPSVLSYAIYLYAVYLISFRLKNRGLALACFLLLNLNPFMLDFFGLARGYGLAIAFMLLSFYHLLRFADKNADVAGRRDVFMVILPAALSVLSNLVFLFYLLSAVALLLFLYFFSFAKEEKKISWRAAVCFFRYKQVPVIIVSTGLYLLALTPLIAYMVWAETFFFGGTHGLWQDTFKSLIQASLYGKEYSASLISFISCAMAATFLFSVVTNIREVFKGRVTSDYLLSTVVFLLMVSQAFLHFKLLGAKLIIERTALIFIPFIILLFIYSLHYFGFFGRVLRLISFIVVILTVGLLLFHFINSMNITSAHYVRFDANTRTMLKDLEHYIDSNKIKKEKISLGMIGCFEPGAVFYREKYGYNWLKPLIRDDSLTSHTYDYYYIWDEDAHFTTNIHIPPFEKIKRYDDTKTLLVRKK